MAGDWIRLHRKMLDSAVMRHDGLCHLWVYCLLRANWKSRSILIPGTTRQLKLERGQFLTGRRALHSALYPERDPDGQKIIREAGPPHPSTVWRWLEALELSGQVKIDSAPSYSVITVCNYSTYQDDAPTDAPDMRQPCTEHAPTVRQPCAQNKNEIREEGKEGKKGDEPPSDLVQKWFFFNPGGKAVSTHEIATMFDEIRRHGVSDAEIEAELTSPDRTRGEWPSKFRDRLIAKKKGTMNGKTAKKSFAQLMAEGEGKFG